MTSQRLLRDFEKCCLQLGFEPGKFVIVSYLRGYYMYCRGE